MAILRAVWLLALVAVSAILAQKDASADSAAKDSKKTGSMSGLAWDKHDFDVSNNKGGDVKVEVNLAAPMTADAPPEEDIDVSELAPLLAPEDPVNPIEMMSMMRDLMAAMKPEEPPAINITQVIEEFKETIPPPAAPPPPPPAQDLTPLLETILAIIKANRPAPQVQYLPAPPAGETIIEAVQPAPVVLPQTAAPAFNVADFMRELRDTMAANKPPPAPPAGIDPQLLDLIKQTQNDLHDMKKELEHPVQPIPTPPPAPAPVAPVPAATPIPLPEVFMPPPPPAVQQQAQTQDSLKDLIQAAIQQIKPPTVPIPPVAQDSDLEKLRDLLRAQQAQATKPIILPPPVAPVNQVDSSSLFVPPPPPPAMESVQLESKLRGMLSGMIAKPQRIPAPPTINVRSQIATSACCPNPTPDDRRPDEERCPLINGLPRPRCKRERVPPPASAQSPQAVKCARAPCNTNDEDRTAWLGDVPDGMQVAQFNPKKLLRALCPGGLCPGQKDLDPRLNPKGREIAQSVSV